MADFMSRQLDPTDMMIIEIMQADGRISVSELGRKVGLSQPAASERLKRLEERGSSKATAPVSIPRRSGWA